MGAESPAAIRALHIITSTARRGAEVFACDLADRLRPRGVDSGLVALTTGPGERTLNVEALGDRRFGLQVLTGLRARIRASQVVVAHGSSALPAAVIAGAGTGVPLVYRSIGDTRAWTGTWSRRTRVRLLLHRTAAVVALWEEAATALTDRYGLPPNRVRTIPNAVAAERFRPPTAKERAAARETLGLDEDGPVIAFVGALSEEKNPLMAVEVVAAIPEARLLMAGVGPERSQVSALATTRMPERSTLVGSVEDVRSVYWAADVLILTSRTEGMPAAPIEAGLCAVPTVASHVGAVPDVVIDEQTGFLFDLGEVRAATAQLSRALQDRVQLGKAARAHCLRNFDLEAVADAWVRLLTAAATRPA